MAMAGRMLSAAHASTTPRCPAVQPAQLLCRQPFLGGTGALRVAAPLRRARAERSGALRCAASTLTVKDAGTGIEFPLVNEFWVGDTYRAMGAGCRTKKIAIVKVKVYAVSLYVEAERAAKELGVRGRGGFFEGDDDYCIALTDGAFNKVLQIEMARDVDGATFAAALQEGLGPRMALMGETATLDKFMAFFNDKKIGKGTTILLMWHQPDSLEVAITADKGSFVTTTPGLALQSPGLCRALFEVFLGSSSVVPEAKAAWAAGARGLIESDAIRRQDRKSGA